MKHNIVKNPDWWEANQLVILQAWPRITMNKSSQQSERDLNLGPPNHKSSALATGTHCLLVFLTVKK